MTMKFNTTTTLNVYKAGNELIFTDRRVLCCRFNHYYDVTKADISLVDYENDDVREEDCTELGELKIEKAILKADHISNLIHIELGGDILTVKTNDFGSDDKYIAFAIDNLFKKPEFQYIPTDDELEFIERVLGRNRLESFYRVLDLNKVCAELETYIKTKLTTSFE